MRDRLNSTHELQMLPLRVVDQCHSRLGDLRQISDFTGMVHPQFHNTDTVISRQAQQCERHTNVVV